MSMLDEWITAAPSGGGDPDGCSAFFWILIGLFFVLVIGAIFVDCILRGMNVDFQILNWCADLMTELTRS